MFVAPFDIIGRDRCAVVEMDVVTEPERGALGILGNSKRSASAK